MEYTVKKLAQLAGISSRTLHYYHEFGILPPARINSSGYRIYGPAEVNRLQHIMFFKELGVKLENIQDIMTNPEFDPMQTLRKHRQMLGDKREQLDVLIANVDKTIAVNERGLMMKDREKFAGFKQKLVEDNEKKYGAEIRTKYGDEVVNKSNQKVANMSSEQYEEVMKLAEELMVTLQAALLTGDAAGELAQKAADLHRRWLSFYWDSYSKEAHMGLAQMYVDDERFTAYYDAQQPGTAAFLRDAVVIYVAGK
ncbi:MAG: MerR family transcriptional regulator [Firmicutes bacterium]|nr:MerR family transcriptional regulator [Bacillota bacterium]